MKLEDILKKQKDKGKEIPRFKTPTLSIEDYTRDKNAPRPYNDNFIHDADVTKEDPTVKVVLDFDVQEPEVKVAPKVAPEVAPKVHKTPTPKKSLKKRGKKEWNYDDLSGNAKLFIDELVNICLVLGGLTTNYIEKKELCKRLGIKVGSLKTTCVRLKEKNVLENFETTKGRGSKWKFTLSNRILQQFKDVSIS